MFTTNTLLLPLLITANMSMTQFVLSGDDEEGGSVADQSAAPAPKKGGKDKGEDEDEPKEITEEGDNTNFPTAEEETKEIGPDQEKKMEQAL
jgi:hypothetical protein